MHAKHSAPSKQNTKTIQEAEISDLLYFQHHTKSTNSKLNKIQEEILNYRAKIQLLEQDCFSKGQELSGKERQLKQAQQIVLNNTHSLKIAMSDPTRASRFRKSVAEEEVSLFPRKQLAANKHLYEEINNLRSEKNMYQKINRDYLKEIDQRKEDATLLISKIEELAISKQRIEEQIKGLELSQEQSAGLAMEKLVSIKNQIDEENRRSRVSFQRSLWNSKHNFAIKNFRDAAHNSEKGGQFINHANLTKNGVKNKEANDPQTNVFSITQAKEKHYNDTFANAYHKSGYLKENQRNFSEPRKNANKPMNSPISFYKSPPRASHSISKKFLFSGLRGEKEGARSGILMSNVRRFEAERKELKSQVNELKDIFEHLYSETKTSNTDELIRHIRELEEEKAKLYFSTQAMLEQIEMLKDSKLALQLEIKEREAEKQNNSLVKEKANEDFSEATKEIDTQIEALAKKKTAVQSIAKCLGHGIVTILERGAFGTREKLFVSNISITNENVPYYLYMLEKKTNKILKIIKDKNLQEQLLQIERAPEKKAFLDEKIKEGIHLFEEIVSGVKRN